MTKTTLHSDPSSTARAEMRQVARALRKARQQTAKAGLDGQHNFQITIDGKVVSAEPPIETEFIKIAVSSEVLEHIARVIADAADVTVKPRSPFNELTTQQAADLLGVSRPYLIKLLDADKIPYRRVGHYRRIRRDDIDSYERAEALRREAGLTELAAFTQEIGLDY